MTYEQLTAGAPREQIYGLQHMTAQQYVMAASPRCKYEPRLVWQRSILGVPAWKLEQLRRARPDADWKLCEEHGRHYIEARWPRGCVRLLRRLRRVGQ